MVFIKKNNIIRKLNTSTTAIPIVIEIGIANNINGNTFLLKWFVFYVKKLLRKNKTNYVNKVLHETIRKKSFR